MRLAIFIVASVIMAVLVVMTVDLDTGADKIFGEADGVASALDTPEGRTLTVLLRNPDVERRNAEAREIGHILQADDAVQSISVGLEAPDPALIDWIWTHRYLLTPMTPEVVQPDAMTVELSDARDALSTLTESMLATRYLLDPAGSFRRSLEGMRADSAFALKPIDGLWQTRDGQNTVLFVHLDPGPFWLEHHMHLEAKIRDAATGTDVLITGPRAVSARISEQISSRSFTVAISATVLLSLWLIWLGRSLAGVCLLVAPVVAGACVAMLAVQAVFGSVHVIALGFGGALMGLAMDYPVHLASHSQTSEARGRALRCIGIGAATTATAFLTLIGSGMPAIMQVGVFVAVGLTVSAGGCYVLVAKFVEMTPRPGVKLPQCQVFPNASFLFAVIAGVTCGAIWLFPESPGSTVLVDLPDDLKAELAMLHETLDLPSGQFSIEVTGDDPKTLLERQRQLLPILERAQSSGEFAESRLLADAFPGSADPVELDERFVVTALANAGLTVDFADRIRESHLEAVERAHAPLPLPQAALESPMLRGMIRRTAEGYVGPVHLWDVRNPDALSVRVTDAGISGIRFIDRRGDIDSRIATLTERVLWCLLAGSVLAAFQLIWLLGRTRDLIGIVSATAAAASLTSLAAYMLSGELGIFQIISLILVIGIGVDYGLFLRSAGEANSEQIALGSVLRCAVTTLMAFGVMALSGITVLESIGLTVSVGVILMVLFHAVRPAER